MKLFIAIDREGITGVVAEQDADRQGPAAERAMRLMRADLDAALAGCAAAGARDVIVCDAHDDGRSLSADGLPEGVMLVGGSPTPLSMLQGLEAGIDGALFVGYHARAGAAGAVLEHTWNYKVFSITCGDLELGELGIGALLAGHFGVPALYASGDDKLAEEAQALAPGIVTTVVKRGLSRYAAELLPPEQTQRRIRADVTRALQAAHKPAPLAWSGAPLRLTFTRTQFCDQATFCPGVERLDGRTLQLQGPDFLAVYRTLLTCFKLSELQD
jgi:D-amino peptidase